ncbi:MAG: hypothetical protein H0V93_09510 [Euzebyales bacterium]|nr:hypothetical protein [Euzebyales bacterium]
MSVQSRLGLALLAGALVLAACVEDVSSDGPQAAQPAATATFPTPASPAPTATPEPTATLEPTASPTGVAEDGEGVTSAQAWVAAVAAGETDTAFELMGEASQEAVGGREGFEQLSSALSEGVAAFSRADDARWTETAAAPGGEESVVVVTVTATVTREGMTEYDAFALPVTTAGDRPQVEPFAAFDHPGGDIEWDVEAASGAYTAFVPATAEVTFAVDGDGLPPAGSEPADGDRQRATLAVDLEPGRHTVSVLWVTPAGLGADAIVIDTS